MHHHEAAAADIAGIGQGHGQRKAYGHGSIDGIAARLENIHADLRGQLLLRGHHAVLGDDGVKDIQLEVIGGSGCLGGGALDDGRRWRLSIGIVTDGRAFVAGGL